MDGATAPSTSGPLEVSARSHSIQTAHEYIVTAMELNDEVDVGVLPPQAATHTVDDYPDPVQANLEELAATTLDWSRLEAEVDTGELPRIGWLVLSRIDRDHVAMRVEWEPQFVQ